MRFTYKLNDSRSTEQVKKVGSIRSKLHIQYDVNERRMNGKKSKYIKWSDQSWRQKYQWYVWWESECVQKSANELTWCIDIDDMKQPWQLTPQQNSLTIKTHEILMRRQGKEKWNGVGFFLHIHWCICAQFSLAFLLNALSLNWKWRRFIIEFENSD